MNMSAPIEELTEKAKNWNDLPVEMKMKCIGKMDFKTRTLLRSTSKSDRQMVDSVKHVFDNLYLNFVAKSTEFKVQADSKEELIHIKFSGEEEEDEYNREIDLSTEVEKFERISQNLKQILEHSKIGRFSIDINCEETNNPDVKLIREMIESGPLLQISRLEFTWQPDSSIQMAILKKCDASLKDIQADSFLHTDFDKLQEFLFLPQVIFAEKIEMGSAQVTAETVQYGMAVVNLIMYRWFTLNSSIGKELSLSSYPIRCLSLIEERFPERVVHRDLENSAIRFRTDDINNHLWLRISPRDQFLQCFIVAADSEHPDFQRMDYLRLDEPLETFRKIMGDLVNNTNYDNLFQSLKLDDSDPEDYADYNEDWF